MLDAARKLLHLREVSRRAAWRLHDRVRSGLLVDARDYYVAFSQAAESARRSILLLGWQFDSDVELVRGDDLPTGADAADYRLLAMLDRLCRQRESLEVRILAWNHSVVFAFEREMLQELVFSIATCKRFHFRFDDTVRLPGACHQKVAIVDGRLAFTGSADLCQERWDESRHLARNPRRRARGALYKPFHEVQVALAGAPARSLVDHFVDRWHHATGELLDAEALVLPEPAANPRISVTLPMPETTIALSRTVPDDGVNEPAQEIRNLYVDAIASADRLVYVETQYLTSAAVRDALVRRMTDASRPQLDILVVLPQKPERFKEELTVGLSQAQIIGGLAAIARATGHGFGVYNVAADDAGAADGETFVYIHSKVMIIDDRFLTVGSANLTNRSMSIDSEINVTFTSHHGNAFVERAIRRARLRLMTEHLGVRAAPGLVSSEPGLVARLHHAIDDGKVRLCRHVQASDVRGSIAKAVQEFAGDYFDPAHDGLFDPIEPSG